MYAPPSVLVVAWWQFGFISSTNVCSIDNVRCSVQRYNDILELLGVCESNLGLVREAYEAARHNEDLLVAARPTVKTILGDLRSVLDYSAMSIFEAYSTKDWSPHFPYGKDEHSFTGAVKKNLNGLREQMPDVYKLVRSIQPYVCGDSWLADLCIMTNVTKHRNLGVQRRVNSSTGDVRVGNLFRVSGGSKIILRNSTVNGERVGNGKPVIISDSASKKELEAVFGKHAQVTKSYDWVKFEFEEFPCDALEFLGKTLRNTKNFVDELSALVEL